MSSGFPPWQVNHGTECWPRLHKRSDCCRDAPVLLEDSIAVCQDERAQPGDLYLHVPTSTDVYAEIMVLIADVITPFNQKAFVAAFD